MFSKNGDVWVKNKPKKKNRWRTNYTKQLAHSRNLHSARMATKSIWYHQHIKNSICSALNIRNFLPPCVFNFSSSGIFFRLPACDWLTGWAASAIRIRIASAHIRQQHEIFACKQRNFRPNPSVRPRPPRAVLSSSKSQAESCQRAIPSDPIR